MTFDVKQLMQEHHPQLLERQRPPQRRRYQDHRRQEPHGHRRWNVIRSQELRFLPKTQGVQCLPVRSKHRSVLYRMTRSSYLPKPSVLPEHSEQAEQNPNTPCPKQQRISVKTQSTCDHAEPRLPGYSHVPLPWQDGLGSAGCLYRRRRSSGSSPSILSCMCFLPASHHTPVAFLRYRPYGQSGCTHARPHYVHQRQHTNSQEYTRQQKISCGRSSNSKQSHPAQRDSDQKTRLPGDIQQNRDGRSGDLPQRMKHLAHASPSSSLSIRRLASSNSSSEIFPNSRIRFTSTFIDPPETRSARCWIIFLVASS